MFRTGCSLLMVGLSLLSEGCAASQPSQSRPKRAILESTLANGLSVVLQRDERVPTVDVALVFKVGTRSSFGPALPRFAFRTLLSKSQARLSRPPNGRPSAYTLLPGLEYSTTTFVTSALSSEDYLYVPRLLVQTASAMDAISQPSLHALMQKLPLETASYYGLFAEPEDSCGPRQIAHCTPEVLAAFLWANYRPQNAVLSVVGDINLDDAIQRIRTYFGDWEGRSDVPVDPPRQPILSGSRSMAHRASSSSKHEIIWAVPDANEAELFTLEMVGDILVMGLNDLGGLSIDSRAPGFRMILESEAPEAHRLKIDAALAKLATVGPPPGALEAARAQSKRYLLHRFYRMDGGNGRAAYLALAKATYGHSDHIQESLKVLDAISAEDVRRTVKLRLLSSTPVVLSHLPTTTL